MDQELNNAQWEAITTTEGPLRVIAGAGSGKTRALTHRYAFLVNEMGVPPGNILCVTFTNKAAGEMRQRIHNLIGDEDTAYINTFHGFCVSVLQEDSHAVGYPKSFLVLDNSDIDAMLRIIYEERGLTLRDRTFSDARDMIEIQKLKAKPDYYKDLIGMSLEELEEKYRWAATRDDIIFYGYLYQQKKCFGLDYNDLIIFTLHIFARDPMICRKWQERLQYIMIDEFQDIDGLQYELMKVLSGYHHNLFIVGDPDQTIYSWRGADVRYLLNFDKDFPGTETILMLENYRSTPQVLEAANALIDKNRLRVKKELIPRREPGPRVQFYYAKTAEEEGKWIVSRIRALREAGASYRDMTLLYRAHYLTRPLEKVLLEEKIPYHIYSGVPFFGRAEIKDALSYLRMAVMQDDLSFRRIANVPKRNLGRRRMAFLENYGKEHSCTLYEGLKRNLDEDLFKGTRARKFVALIEEFSGRAGDESVSELLSALLDRSGYEEMLRTEGCQERLDNLAELKQSVYEYETTCGEEAGPRHYLSHVALFSNSDAEDRSDKVKLMTIHAAKGLEFPYVFLCGMNEGIFPSRRVRDRKALEEERRLAFVAMTRACRQLHLSAAEGRNHDGTFRYPSRFLLDVGEEHMEMVKKPEAGLIADARNHILRSEQILPDNLREKMLKPGTRVRHTYLGNGTILETDAEKGQYRIRFDGLPTPRTLSFRAKVEPLSGKD